MFTWFHYFVTKYKTKNKKITLVIVRCYSFLSSISRFPKHGVFFVWHFQGARRWQGRLIYCVFPTRPTSLPTLFTWSLQPSPVPIATDFCFDALALGYVLILASGHMSGCKACCRNRLCLEFKLRPVSHAGLWRHSLSCARPFSAHTRRTSNAWVTILDMYGNAMKFY